jgi:hypothetical protein
MSIIEKLTEGVVRRNVQKEGAALLDKWEKTGLLEGIENDNAKNSMACLLENQAKELLREASSMSAGDVEGFAAVAFPIVRRVFGGLIANELVSVQPMSLPSGLIFFLDFTFQSAKLGAETGASLYGGGKVGNQITGGVNLTGDNVETSFYALNNGYASPTGSLVAGATLTLANQGTVGGANDALNKLCQYDPDMSGSEAIVVTITGSADLAQFNTADLVALKLGSSQFSGSQRRRLTQLATGSTQLANPGISSFTLTMVIEGNGAAGIDASTLAGQVATGSDAGNSTAYTLEFPITDNFVDANALGAVVGAPSWGLENSDKIPEIDIKVDSVSVTAITKKLKAKWTPELQQDINAYHNLDAEVELTSILSEQIALEIDQEILEDLVKGATAGTFYWSRKPGKFVDRTGGQSVNESLFPDFTGTVSEWYETLLETINDVSAQIHRKTLRGGANFIVVSPEVANVLEFTAGFRADTTADENRGTAGAVRVGQINKKLDIYVDPYFPRNVVLVGRKGNSFLESGYVYAPYVPLQVTPTIFGPEDFVPRKGVMTRYGKKMVRPDMYGLVIVEDLLG